MAIVEASRLVQMIQTKILHYGFKLEHEDIEGADLELAFLYKPRIIENCNPLDGYWDFAYSVDVTVRDTYITEIHQQHIKFLVYIIELLCDCLSTKPIQLRKPSLQEWCNFSTTRPCVPVQKLKSYTKSHYNWIMSKLRGNSNRYMGNFNYNQIGANVRIRVESQETKMLGSSFRFNVSAVNGYKDANTMLTKMRQFMKKKQII